MTGSLPGSQNSWNALNAIVGVAQVCGTIYSARVEASNIDKKIKAIREFQGNDRALEDMRQEFELAQLKKQHLMQLEAQEHSAREARKNRAFMERENRLNREFQAKLTEYIQQCENARMQARFDFEQFLFQERKKLDIELQRRDHKFTLLLAALEWQNTRQMDEYKRTLDNHPWRLYPDTIRQFYNQYQDSSKPVPPLVIISPPEVDFDKFPNVASGLPKMEKGLAEELRRFLQNHYPIEHPQRPTHFVGGMWDTKRLHGETAVMHLFSLLKSVPTFILESEIDGDYLNFRIASWDIGENKYDYNSILSQFPYKEFFYHSARNYAWEWKTKKARLMQQFLPMEIERLEPDNEFNLQQLEFEERLRAAGYDKPPDYRVTGDCVQELFKYLKILHCVVAGIAADEYYFRRYSLSPQLPDLLLGLIQDLPDYQGNAIIKVVVDHYYSYFEELLQDRDARVPKLALDVANSLAKLPDKSFEREMTNYVVKSKLRLRGA